jgi:lipopolysaccharide/colanic/teichoic acid biosynthesis glycosyltransferase
MPSSISTRRPVRTFVELEQPDEPQLAAGAGGHEPLPERFEEAVDWERLTPRGVWAGFGRPMLDEVLLALTLPPAVLLIALVAVANAIAFGSPRRVFFIQPRVGHRGRIFRLIKFRTMSEPKGSVFEAWAGGDVARVTRFGKFLRSTHLDELPQLFNVLRGEMGFIGPRPEMLEVEEWAGANVPGFLERMAIKPGITGWAQITQGYTPKDVAAYARKLELNREYLARLSFTTDMGILARTLVWMVLGRGWRWKK